MNALRQVARLWIRNLSVLAVFIFVPACIYITAIYFLSPIFWKISR